MTTFSDPPKASFQLSQLIYDTRKARNIQTGNRKAEKPADGSIAWMAPKRGRVAQPKMLLVDTCAAFAPNQRLLQPQVWT